MLQEYKPLIPQFMRIIIFIKIVYIKTFIVLLKTKIFILHYFKSSINKFQPRNFGVVFLTTHDCIPHDSRCISKYA